MFDNFKKPMQQTQSRPMNVQANGCKIKVKRDSSGRISSIETNGKCTKTELEIFRENMDIEESEEE